MFYNIGCMGVQMLFNTLVVWESTCCTTHWLYGSPHAIHHIGSLGVDMLNNTSVVWESTCVCCTT